MSSFEDFMIDKAIKDAAREDQLREKVNTLREAIDPEVLEEIANELTEFHHSARADSLRVVARQQRAALAKI